MMTVAAAQSSAGALGKDLVKTGRFGNPPLKTLLLCSYHILFSHACQPKRRYVVLRRKPAAFFHSPNINEILVFC